MATKPATTSGATTSKKAKGARGPQKRTFHFFVKVVDASGNVIPGAQLHVERVLSDARKVVEFLDTPEYNGMGLTRIKYEMTSNPREDDEANKASNYGVGSAG